jgi:hypothetical protein
LNVRLADVRMEGAKLAEENARLREELIALRQRAELRASMKYRDNVYWQEPEGGAVEGPFCPKCFDGSARAARMADRAQQEYWRCPVCDLIVDKPNRRPPAPASRRHAGPSDWMAR